MDPATEFTAAMRRTAKTIRAHPLFDEHLWKRDAIYAHPEPKRDSLALKLSKHVSATPEPAAAAAPSAQGAAEPAVDQSCD